METIIKAENLTRKFGEFIAVDHIAFTVNRGEIIGYLGPNGSGKTTTIRMLLGLLLPTEGHATVLGYNTRTQAEQIKNLSGYMSQKFSLYHDLTIRENLEFYSGVYGTHDRKDLKRVLEKVELQINHNTRVQDLSTGWRQRLALAVAIVHRPQLLFLDEPTSGVDPIARRNFWDLIYTLASEGMTVMVTTHYMDEAEYCQRVGIMRNGKLLAMDTPFALKQHYIHGIAWECNATPLLLALQTLQNHPSVIRCSLAGDRLRVILNQSTSPENLLHTLSQNKIKVSQITAADLTLEDVFLALAAG